LTVSTFDLPDTFSVQNGLKQGGYLSLILNSELEHSNTEVKKTQDGLEMDGKYQLLVYANDNLLSNK
jgi:hypothetical protein